jgi:hypothetical protein
LQTLHDGPVADAGVKDAVGVIDRQVADRPTSSTIYSTFSALLTRKSRSAKSH